jgi:hypothetical protein
MTNINSENTYARQLKIIKLVISLVAVTYLYMPITSWAQEADGYAFQVNENFTPGIYEALVDAKVYYDIDKKAVQKDSFIKKGTQISVYSAGYHGAQQPSIDWLNLSEGQECNGKILPWEKFGWIGTLIKDFKRIGDLPKPIYKNGIITNCATIKQPSPISDAGLPLLVIKSVSQVTPDKGIISRSPIKVTGKIEFGHDAAGGSFMINDGKNGQYNLGYVWDIDEATQAELGKIADAGTTVTVKGILKVWKDGSSAFDNTDPISIFK